MTLIIVRILLVVLFVTLFARNFLETGARPLFEAFSTTKRPTGRVHWFHTIRTRTVGALQGYIWLHTASADSTGLYFGGSILALSRRRLHIPWTEIQVQDEDPDDWRMELFVPRVQVEFRMNKALVRRLLEEGGQPLPSILGRA